MTKPALQALIVSPYSPSNWGLLGLENVGKRAALCADYFCDGVSCCGRDDLFPDYEDHRPGLDTRCRCQAAMDELFGKIPASESRPKALSCAASKVACRHAAGFPSPN